MNIKKNILIFFSLLFSCVGFSQRFFNEDSTIIQDHEAFDLNSLADCIPPEHPRLNVALDQAAKMGNIPCTKFLLALGARPESEPYSNNRPFCMAIDSKNDALIRILAPHVSINTICPFVNFKTQLCSYDITELTPLSMAAYANDIELASYLIACGANVNDDSSMEALCIAAENGFTDMAQLLLKNGANVRTDCLSNTPRSIAIERNHAAIVKLLLEYGANPYARNSDLRIAIEHDYAAIVKLLLEYGANPYARNSDNEDALQLAARHSSTESFHAINAYIQKNKEKK